MRVFKCNRGIITVEFLICGLVLFFLVFVSTDYWLIQVKNQQADHIKNYYLDRIRVEGYLTDADRNDMIQKFNAIDCQVQSIDAPVTPVLRNVDDPTQSEVWLRVEAKPNTQPFFLGTLIGADAPDGSFLIRVSGRALSERVNP
jgi:hypothetical protein